MSNGEARQLEPWSDLNGKVVLVTGASSGIGKEFCIELAKAGCKIIAAARRVDRLKSLCDAINHRHSSLQSDQLKAMPVEFDVTGEGAEIEAAVKKAWDAFGRIDVLINNAGIRGRIHTLIDLTDEEWNHTIQTNLTSVWRVSKYVCIRMRDAELGGSIINISSTSGLQRGHLPGGFAYDTSKSALNTLTKAMALELGKYNIRVNSIAPGIFKSEITESLVKKVWLKKVVERTVPLRILGTIDPALTSLVHYLIHDSSKYVSGNIYIVDCGHTLPGFPLFASL